MLLMDGTVERIIINDYDKAIYSFWRAIKEETQRFVELIAEIPISIEEWQKQKAIYTNSNSKYSFELGFATFFLNRTNRSGILTAGPIGGFKQQGNYLIDARFNRKDLIKRIKTIAERKNSIFIYNKDIKSFIIRILPKYQENAFVYFDPPYFNKGKKLYKNFLTTSDHKKIGTMIFEKIDCDWMVTYDDVPEILHIYKDYSYRRFDLNYSVANSRTASEIMILSKNDYWPSKKELECFNIRINLR